MTAPRDRERGAAAVEMALLLPLLVVLAFGVIQVGLGYGQVMAVGNAAREGARYASQARDCSEIVARTTASVRTRTLDPGAVTNFNIAVRGVPADGSPFALCGSLMSVPCDNANAHWVSVEVSFDRAFSIPFVGIDESEFTIKRKAVFLCE